MAKPVHVETAGELHALRERLEKAEQRTCAVIEAILRGPKPLRRLKFELLGCDPLDESVQNVAEQIDQQATYEVALDGLEWLMARHPAKRWEVAPGAHGAGHDLVAADGEVAAEVFAAVKPGNNDKLKKDIAKVSTFAGPHRYVIYRSPASAAGERLVGSVVVVSLGP